MIRVTRIGLLALALSTASLFSVPADAQLSPNNQQSATQAAQSQTANPAAVSPQACLPSQNITGNYSYTAAANLCIDGNLTATGTIYIIPTNANATVTITGTVKSTNTAGLGAITIEAPTITTGDISTPNSPVAIGNFSGPSMGGPVTLGNVTTTKSLVFLENGGTNMQLTVGNITTTIGYISVLGFDNTVQTGALKTSENGILVNGLTINVMGAINTTSGGGVSGNVELMALSTIETEAITTSLGGAVYINPQSAAGNALFTIGGTGQTNGVNGKITTTGAGGTAGTYSSWVYVENGIPGSTGGITMTTTTDIAVSAGSGARNGTIILNAQNGPLNIPASTTPLSVAGTGNIGGGLLLLMGQSVNFAGTVELNASQTTTTGFGHEILIDAATITYSGNLTLDSNGPGTAMYLGGVGLQYFGATAVTVSGGGSSMTINVGSAGNAFSPLTVIGGGTLDMTGNGDNTVAAITAYPIAITGGSLTLQSQGTTNHGVYISNGSALTGQVGLTFGETSGTVTLDATPTPSSGAGGGYIQVNVDGAAFNAPTFVINASATSGNAQGGTVTITSSNLQLNTNSEATVTANGEGSLTGASGGTITITSTGTEPITLGTGAGDFSLTANSGATAGAGGTVEVTTGGELSLTGNFSVTAKGNGTGGTINLTGSTINIPTTSNTVLTATSAATEGNGTGGKISLTATGAGVTIGTGDNQISLNASDSTSGGGGFVAVTAAGPITAQGSAINVAAGPTSGAAPNAGGTITLTTSSGSISASGTFQASGGPLGTGGAITFQSAQNINLADQTQLIADGNGSGGVGGEIELGTGSGGGSGTINYATSNISIDASGLASKGGNILIQTADPTGESALNILGPITNNGTVVGRGTVTITNEYPVGLVVNTAIISATNGEINFQSNSGPVTVIGIAPSGQAGPYFGPVSLEGTNLSLQANGSAVLLLGTFNATGNINVQTDVGNMMSDGNNDLIALDETITFTSTSGEVGTSTLSPVNVNSPTVNFDFGETPASGSAVYLNASGSLTVQNAADYGNIFITGDANITLSQNIATTQGSVGITSTGGAIVVANTGILAREGTISLQAATAITLQLGSRLAAITTTTNAALGNVSITLNGPPSFTTGLVPPNVTITSGATEVFFGAMGIAADAPTNTLSSTGGRYLAFDTNGLLSQFILLAGGVNISAAGQ